MRISTILAGAVLALSFAVAPTPSMAAPAVPGIKIDSSVNHVQKVHRRGWRHGHRHWRYNRCHRWRNRCAYRWGWGGYRFRRCLRRHGC